MCEKTKVSYFVPGAFNLFCLGVAVAGFSTLVSSLDQYRWRTIGVVVGVYIVLIVVKLLGQTIDEVAWLQYLSIFTAYEPQKFIDMAVHRPEMVWNIAWVDSVDQQKPLIELGALAYNLILLVAGIVCYVIAGIAFHRRDLPAPL